MASFDVYVSKDTFKFNAAHFVAFDGFRERLHGHNYRVGIRLVGTSLIGRDGYVIDFTIVKHVCKKVCKSLNEHLIVPLYSDVIKISTLAVNENEVVDSESSSESIQLVCQDGTYFVVPRQDCLFLPIVHATAEELAIYLWSELLEGFQASYLLARGITSMEVTVAEAPGQEARFQLPLSSPFLRQSSDTHNENKLSLDVRAFITQQDIVPLPCHATCENQLTKAFLLNRKNDDMRSGPNPTFKTRPGSPPSSICIGETDQSGESLQCTSSQLQHLARAINEGKLPQGSPVSVQDLEALIRSTRRDESTVLNEDPQAAKR